jgi:hypothetical protein
MEFMGESVEGLPIPLNICFDTYGNVYFKLSKAYKTNPDYFDDKSEQILHQINVNGKNIPYFELGEYDIINKQHKKIYLHKITPTKKKNSDDKSLENEIDLLHEDNDYYCDDIDGTNNTICDLSSNQSCVINEDVVNKYGSSNIEFEFLSCGNHMFNVDNRHDGDICALYDTYVYDANILCFCSKSTNGYALYRMNIRNNNLSFRSIGYTETVYKIIVRKDSFLKIVNVSQTE